MRTMVVHSLNFALRSGGLITVWWKSGKTSEDSRTEQNLSSIEFNWVVWWNQSLIRTPDSNPRGPRHKLITAIFHIKHPHFCFGIFRTPNQNMHKRCASAQSWKPNYVQTIRNRRGGCSVMVVFFGGQWKIRKLKWSSPTVLESKCYK